MSVTHTYYPDTAGNYQQWSASGSPHYDMVDEETPNETDYVNTATAGKYEGFLAANSTVDYASCAYVPWETWVIEIYAKGAGAISNACRGYLRVGGTNYSSSYISVTTTWTTYTFTWTSSPWTGDDWAAPNAIEFGVYTHPFMAAVTLYVSAIRLKCTRPDHTAGSCTTPTTPLVQTYNNKQTSPEEDGEYNPTDLVDWEPKFSIINADASSLRQWYVQVGTTLDGSDVWDSGWTAFTTAVAASERSEKIAYASANVLQDGKTYYWRIKVKNAYCEESAYLTGGTFLGVTDTGWWDADYNKRFNIRAGTSHSGLGIGYTAEVDIATGVGVQISDKGVHNGAVTQVCHYGGYYYICWLGFSDFLAGNLIAYVVKYKRGTGIIQTHAVEDLGQSWDTHNYPVLIVGQDEKLHVIVNGHAGQANYYVTTGAHQSGSGIDVTAWTTKEEPACFAISTYCRWTISSAGHLFAWFRGKGDNNIDAQCYARKEWTGSAYGSWSNKKIIAWYSDDVEGGSACIYSGGVCIDSNDRAHIALTWWEDYGSGGNLGRAISYMYSDIASGWYTTWYEKEQGNAIGTTTETAGSDNVQYNDCNKVATCGTPTYPIAGPFVHTNENYLCVDNNNNPYFNYKTYPTDALHVRDETPIMFCRWSGSAWTITNLYTESGVNLWSYLHGGAMYYHDGYISVYGSVKPSGETWFGSEFYRWRFTISTSSWSYGYLTGNSGLGLCGMDTTPTRTMVSGDGPILAYTRGPQVMLWWDETYDIMRQDGADMRIIAVDYNSGSPSRTEIDRVPRNSFGLAATKMLFGLTHGITSNLTSETNKLYQVYIGKQDASSPPDDTDNIFRYLENFEDVPVDTTLEGYNGWTVDVDANMKCYRSNYNANYSGAGPAQVYDGDSYLAILDNAVATKDLNDTYPGMGTDISNKYIVFHSYEAGSDGHVYLELWDETDSKYVRIGYNGSTTKACYKTTSGAWTDCDEIQIGRHHTFKILVKGGFGVYFWVDDDSQLSYSGEITVFDKIKIGMSDRTSGSHVIDQIYIYDYVADDPEWTTTQTTPDTKYETAYTRVGQSAILAHQTYTRTAEKVIPEKTATTVLAERVIAEAAATTRRMDALLPDKAEITALMEKAILEDTDIAALAQKLILETGATTAAAHLLLADKEFFAALMHHLIMEQAKYGRIRHDVLFEQSHVTKLAEKAILEQTETTALGQTAIPEATGTTRRTDAVLAEMTATAKLMEKAILEAMDTDALMHALQMDKAVVTRIVNAVLSQSVAVTAAAHKALLEAMAQAKLMQLLILECGATQALAHILLADKTFTTAIAQKVNFEITDTDALMHWVRLQATGTTATAHYMALAKASITALAAVALVEKHTQTRLMHAVVMWIFPEMIRLGPIAFCCAECRNIMITQARMSAPKIQSARMVAPVLTSARMTNPKFSVARMEPTKYDAAGDPIWIR